MNVLYRPPFHTSRFENLRTADLDLSWHFVFAVDSTEERGQLSVWDELRRDRVSQCDVILKQEPDRIEVECAGEPSQSVVLKDEANLARMLAHERLYLDISGLAHQVWAPLLRIALREVAHIRVVYAEPLSYKPHQSPASPTLFDLSTRFRGLAPLPGMAQLAGPADEARTVLVAFLGFEGNRAQHIALTLDPAPKVIPVIGVPGFRMEYPAFTVACNRDFLAEFRAHSELRFARASCPFEAREVLAQLRVDYPDYHFYIAPVGTKPHALGAIQYAIENPSFTEVIYDHPVRKKGRTRGVGQVHIYELKR